MKGKATFILTDKYTKKPVKQITEHNLVTKALEKVLFPPPITRITMGTSNFADNYFPICDKLIGGIVLLGNTLPENAEDFMIPPDIIPVGAAGKEYTGTNPCRGTLNISMSGPIENGYMLVWDFAPEKANGVIKCVGLTNFCYGNAAFLKTNEQNCGICTPPINMGQNLASIPTVMSVLGRFYGKAEGTRLYSYTYTSNMLTLYESEISDPRNIKVGDAISDFKTAKVVSEKELELPVQLSSSSMHFYCREDGCLYLLAYNYTFNKVTIYHFTLMKIDPMTGKLLDEKNFEISGEKSFSGFSFAIKQGKIYLSGSGNYATLFTINLSNCSILAERGLTHAGTFNLFEWNGYIMGTEMLSGYYYKFFAEYENYPMLCGGPGAEVTCDLVPIPYSLRYSYDSTRTNFYLMMRTDYLATINNLSAPLEKTDRHALQIRYELTY